MLASLSSHHFEQKLEYFQMTPSLGEISSPGLETMSADQEAVRVWVLGQKPFHLRRRSGPVLRVLEDRQPFAVFVGHDAVQALEHFVAFDGHAVVAGL